MASVEDILLFRFPATALKQSSQKIISPALTSVVDHRIDKLNKITDAIGISSFQFSGENLIPHVFRKFKNSLQTGSILFDRRELRTLTYSLSYSERSLQPIFNQEEELSYALTLLNFNWRDSFLIGLLDCLFRNWGTRNHKSSEMLERLILQRLDAYSGGRSTLASLKNNKRFFSIKNGDVILGDTISKLGRSVQEATGVLSVPESWLTYPYFSRAIVTYYERNKNRLHNIVDDLNAVLQQHNNSTTNKRLLSKIIIQTNQPEHSSLQDKVKDISIKQIGDPGIAANWAAFDNATDTEKSELLSARKILNEWITKQFINVFFNACINDDRRKKFWLRFSSKISSFKVYGPLRTKNILKREQGIAEIIDARFERVQSNRDVSAFILYIGDYMLIEFSNEGYAFYAYKNDSLHSPNLSKQLTSVDDLRNGTMPMLIQSDNYYDYYNEEGRLTHRDGSQLWEARFDAWMNQKVFK